MRTKPPADWVKDPAKVINDEMGSDAKVGLILGTGWSDALKFEDAIERPFGDISPKFKSLPELAGHSRSVIYGKLGGVPVLALRGRLHMNESPSDSELADLVRIQTAMMIEAGVKNLIITNAAGSLSPDIHVGDVVAIDGFVSVFAPPMPLYTGEFVSPDDTIDDNMTERIIASQKEWGVSMPIKTGGYVMVRGPFFEGRKYDKDYLAKTGAKVVGMSTLPEACVAALYPDVRVIPLAFVTNSAYEDHSHEENTQRAKEVADSLGTVLANVVKMAA